MFIVQQAWGLLDNEHTGGE